MSTLGGRHEARTDRKKNTSVFTFKVKGFFPQKTFQRAGFN